MSRRPHVNVELDGLQWRQEIGRAWNLTNGETELAVQVDYRRPPARRWVSFLLFGALTFDGQPDENVLTAILKHERGEGRPS